MTASTLTKADDLSAALRDFFTDLRVPEDEIVELLQMWIFPVTLAEAHLIRDTLLALSEVADRNGLDPLTHGVLKVALRRFHSIPESVASEPTAEPCEAETATAPEGERA